MCWPAACSLRRCQTTSHCKTVRKCSDTPAAPFPDRAPLAGNTSHLRTSHGKLRGERIKQVDKIEKLLLRLKGLRWRHLALLGFVLVVDLLDLPTVDAQTTCRQDVACHLVPQALEQWLGRLLWLQGEGQRDHLGQFKESFGKAEAIGVQLCLARSFR